MSTKGTIQRKGNKVNVKHMCDTFNQRVTEKMGWILANTAGTFSSTCTALN